MCRVDQRRGVRAGGATGTGRRRTAGRWSSAGSPATGQRCCGTPVRSPSTSRPASPSAPFPGRSARPWSGWATWSPCSVWDRPAPSRSCPDWRPSPPAGCAAANPAC
ncbi:hypothetical protein NKG94_29760 [Micromonospora sp. M12]